MRWSIQLFASWFVQVASWGGDLLDRGILTVSLAPRDNHEAQVQFALERGIPAILGIISTQRLPFPSNSFDMAHCSRCLIPWTEYGTYSPKVEPLYNLFSLCLLQFAFLFGFKPSYLCLVSLFSYGLMVLNFCRFAWLIIRKTCTHGWHIIIKW